ncbi:MAG: hypothetical protein Q8P29_00705, partial [Candidatus Levybacteria bacterium]|nr:hypothetical protein [Candidatus Levybacteria bacterium]
VILVVIIASTIGLSIASRSITSLKSSTEEAESQKALAAAEAGIERVTQRSTPIAVDGVNPGNSSYATQVEQVNSTSFLINGGNVIPKDEGADVWFVKHKDDGSLDYTDYSTTSPSFLNLYWGSSSDGCGDAAIQAVIVTRAQSAPYEIKSYRYVYDPCSTRRSENKFTTTNAMVNFKINDVPFLYSTPINNLTKDITPAASKNIILMRVIPIYKDAVIGLDTCNPSNRCYNSTSLPSQGYVVTSIGTSGQANRKITVFKGYPQTYLPYLSYGLFVAN